MRPTNDVAGRLRWLEKVAVHAKGLPDVPEERRVRLQEILDWSRSHDTSMSGAFLPKGGTPEADAIDREARAHHEFCEQDRRARQTYSRIPQNTAADGSGQPVDEHWPYLE